MALTPATGENIYLSISIHRKNDITKIKNSQFLFFSK